MRFRNEESKGWIASVSVHGLLLLFLWMVKVSDVRLVPEFVEVSWSAVGAPPTSAVRGNPASLSGPAYTDRYSSSKVRLPERLNIEPPDEVLRIPESRKEEVADASSSRTETVESRAVGEKGRGFSPGSQEKVEAPLLAGLTKDISPPFGSSVGADAERSVGFEVSWAGGGKRRLLSGKLPEYPAGVNVEAQVKIQAVVLPDGSVKSAQPVQKANTKLEDSALKEIRFWKFEPLPGTISQVEQTCTITFNYLLR